MAQRWLSGKEVPPPVLIHDDLEAIFGHRRRGARDENSLTVRIDIELQAILQHLGPEAPDASTEIEPRVNRDALIRFVTPTAVYSLAGDFAVRLQQWPDGSEDVSYWRDGVQI
jgi:hypothetical protein